MPGSDSRGDLNAYVILNVSLLSLLYLLTFYISNVQDVQITNFSPDFPWYIEITLNLRNQFNVSQLIYS